MHGTPLALPCRYAQGYTGTMTGRPSTYRSDFAESVLEHLSTGGSLRSWCARSGRPSRTSVLRWVLSDIEGFGTRYREARALGCEVLADDLADEARAALKDGDSMAKVTARRLIVDTLKWTLAKRAPDRFGDRLHVHGFDSAPARINIYLPVKGGSDDRQVTIAGSATIIGPAQPVEGHAELIEIEGDQADS
jgi:hypothetical protein